MTKLTVKGINARTHVYVIKDQASLIKLELSHVLLDCMYVLQNQNSSTGKTNIL